MEYIIRDKSIITGKQNLQHLYTFKDFPVFLGCVDHPEKEDLKADMSRSICPESGVIQLDKVLPLDILYQLPHNDGVGKIREDYYQAFAEYIKKQGVKTMLEIGGGGGKVAKNFTHIVPDGMCYMVEPNPLIESDEKIEVIKKFFDKDFVFDKHIDAVTHSQVFEHAYDPVEFLMDISKFLKPGQKHILGFPDIERFMKRKYTNAMNFEHTFFLSEYISDYLFAKAGFKIIDKTRYHDYDLFYTLEKVEDIYLPEVLIFENKYDSYKNIFMEFLTYHEDLIKDFSKKMTNYDGEIYLFGAHIFSQYLIGFGLDISRIDRIIDNSDLKNKKRLYGTPLMVEKPDIIIGKKKVAVILRATIYQEEIRKQLLELNPNVEIWE